MKQKEDNKELGVAQKQLDIARVRGYDAHEVFTYDLVKTAFLFSDEQFAKSNQRSGNWMVYS